MVARRTFAVKTQLCKCTIFDALAQFYTLIFAHNAKGFDLTFAWFMWYTSL